MRSTAWLTLVLAPALAGAQPGTLDPSFGSGGVSLQQLSFYDDEVHALVVQPDGKTIGAGWTDDGANVRAFVQRLNLDGTPDPSFGTGGTVYSQGLGELRYAYAVALQSTGNVLVAGLVYDMNADGNAMLLRLLPDGTPDDSFGTAGYLSLDYGAGFGFQSAWAMAVLPDDRIVLVGEEGENGVACVRLTAEGVMDGAFGTDGLALTGIPFGSGLCVHANSDGSVLVGGYRLEGDSDLLLARFDADGVLDPGFGTSGIALLDLGGGDTEFMRGMDVLPDGRIAVCGSRSFAGLDDEPIVALFTANGQPDTSFDGDGLLLLPYTAPQFGQARGIIAQPDGKLLVSGYRVQPGGVANNDFFLFRLLADGSFDPSFAGGGQVHTDASGAQDRAFAMALAPDGAIVVAGYGTDDWRTAAYARYINDIGTALPSIARTERALVWPNPASTHLMVALHGARARAVLRLIAADGREVLHARIAHGLESGVAVLELPADLASGVYTARIDDAGRTVHASVAVER